MILHLFVDAATFSFLPKDVTSLSLAFSVDDLQTLDTTAPITCEAGKACVISKTLHVPLLDDICRTSVIKIEAAVYEVDGTRVSQGKGSTSVSPVEHGAAKQVNFNDGQKSTGNVVFSVFYYRFPMDINDFQNNDKTIATDQQKKFMREYDFLQKRRERWGKGRASSWNGTSERLLAEDTAVQANSALKDEDRTSKPWETKWTPDLNGKRPKKKSSSQPSGSKSKPQLRKTRMSAYYGGVEWPQNTGDKEEKLMHKLHLAEQKRLQLIHVAAEDARRRNRQSEKRIESIRLRRASSSDIECRRLKSLLKEKEESLRALQSELKTQESRRKNPKDRSTHTSINNKEKQTMRNKNHSANSDTNTSYHRVRKNPSYLAPTLCWTSKSSTPSFATPVDHGSGRKNSHRNEQRIKREKRLKEKKIGDRMVRYQNRKLKSYDRNLLSFPLDVLHGEGESIDDGESDIICGQSSAPPSDSEEDEVDPTLLAKSTSAKRIIQDIKKSHAKIIHKTTVMSKQAGNERDDLKDHKLNQILEKYSSTSQSSNQALTFSHLSPSSNFTPDDISGGSRNSSYSDSLADDITAPISTDDIQIGTDIKGLEEIISRLESRIIDTEGTQQMPQSGPNHEYFAENGDNSVVNMMKKNHESSSDAEERLCALRTKLENVIQLYHNSQF